MSRSDLTTGNEAVNYMAEQRRGILQKIKISPSCFIFTARRSTLFDTRLKKTWPHFVLFIDVRRPFCLVFLTRLFAVKMTNSFFTRKHLNPSENQ